MTTEDGIRISDWSDLPLEVQRWHRLWREAWEMIPDEDRRTMVAWWSGPMIPGLFIDLDDEIGSDEWCDEIYGQVQLLGPVQVQMNFALQHFEWMADEEGIHVILHELAHCYQHATDTYPIGNYWDGELEADEIADRWQGVASE